MRHLAGNEPLESFAHVHFATRCRLDQLAAKPPVLLRPRARLDQSIHFELERARLLEGAQVLEALCTHALSTRMTRALLMSRDFHRISGDVAVCANSRRGRLAGSATAAGGLRTCGPGTRDVVVPLDPGPRTEDGAVHPALCASSPKMSANAGCDASGASSGSTGIVQPASGLTLSFINPCSFAIASP